MQLQFVMNKSAVYTKALGHRAQSPGNINHGRALERGLINGDLDSSQNPQPIKLIAMPGLRNNPAPVKSLTQKRPSFRQRYDELEVRRAELSARLHSLGEAGERQPGHKRALRLLNDIYRKEKLAQRMAVLQAAAWLIDILEKLVSTA